MAAKLLTIERSMKLTDLEKQPLVGGTLIEFEKGLGFSREVGRGTITLIGYVDSPPDYFKIETDGSSVFGMSVSYCGDVEIMSAAGVFFWKSPMGGNYAVVPPDVEIPAPGVLEDAYIDIRQE